MPLPEEPRPSGDGEKKFQLILPSLIPPLPGAFNDVCLDYAVSPERFKVAMQSRIRTENPRIASVFRERPELSDSNLPYQWAHVYYGMFERAARQVGLPPLEVSGVIVDKYAHIELLTIEDQESNRSDEEIVARGKAALEKRKAKDRQVSPELAKFWDSVEADTQKLKDQGKSEIEILSMLLPLTTLQTLLQKQQDAYSLMGAYPPES